MIITELKGYSGSRVQLIRSKNQVYVKKTGNVKRNYQRLTHLQQQGYPVCKVIDFYEDVLILEYIHGLDMLNYLQQHNVNELIKFLCDLFDSFKLSSSEKNYQQIYYNKLSDINFDKFSFTADQLISRIPKFMPHGDYHGDLTLENIIYSHGRGFVLIDAADIEYDGYQFDIAKLSQDIICKWFIRDTEINLDYKLQSIVEQLITRFGYISPELVITQLLRVYKHATHDLKNQQFLFENIETLWKS